MGIFSMFGRFESLRQRRGEQSQRGARLFFLGSFGFALALAGLPASPLQAADFPTQSLYHSEGEWLDQTGKSFHLSALAGKPVVIAMVYLSCQHTCPLTLAKMRAVESAAKAKNLDLEYVMVSFDPKRDTAEKLKAYATKNELVAPSWRLMTSAKESTLREMAGLLDYKYKKLPDGEFEHSLALLLLSPKGEVLSRIEGAGMKPDELLDPLAGAEGAKKTKSAGKKKKS